MSQDLEPPVEWYGVPPIRISVANTGCLVRNVRWCKLELLPLSTNLTPDSSGVVATLKVGSSALTTTKAEAPNPLWNEDFQL